MRSFPVYGKKVEISTCVIYALGGMREGMSASKERGPLAPLAVSDGEKHAEFKRRRDKFEYMQVPAGAEAPYLADGWAVSKKLKRRVRLEKQKANRSPL
jgi:hypothetical protein